MQIGYCVAGVTAVVLCLMAVQVSIPDPGRAKPQEAVPAEQPREEAAYKVMQVVDKERCSKWEWPNPAKIVQPIEHVKECEWAMVREEDLNNKVPEGTPTTPVASFYRSLSAEGEEVDLSATAHTMQRLQSLPHLVPVFGQNLIKWTQRYKGCRSCGYSCAILRKPDGFHPEYPLRRSVKVMAQQGKLFTYENADGEMTDTARYQGWDVQSMGRLPLPVEQCTKVVEDPTFFFKRRNTPYHRNNIAHWLHDLFFPLFMTVHNFMGDTIDTRPYYIIPDLDASEDAFAQNWGMAEHNLLLTALAPLERRLTAGHNHCYTTAVFDCPAPDTMEPIAPLQRWLTKQLSMNFMPEAPVSPTIMVMVRCPGGSRYLENAEDMLQVARQVGYTVKNTGSLPVFAQMNTLVQTFQTTDVVTSIHGSEIAPMLFMRNGSVVIEIVPNEFRYLDSWYISQAAAAGLHLIRLTPNQTNVQYHYNGKSKVCGSSKYKYEKKLKKNIGSQESNYRQLSSTIAINTETWRGVLSLSKELLGSR